VSGARHHFRGASHVTSLQSVLPECRHTRSLSPSIRQRRAFHRVAASFRLGALLVRALSSTHPSDAENLPSDFCHPILSTQSAPVLQSSEEVRRLAPDFSEGPAGSRQSSPLRRDRSIARRGIRSSTSWRSSPLTPLSRSLLASPASQPSDVCLTRLGDFPLRCRDANADFHHPRRLPPVSIRAPDSFRSRARDPLSRSAPVSNLARRRGYASRLAEDSVRLRRLVLAPEVHARGVPAKASSCLLVPFVRTCVQPEDKSFEGAEA
jgi:hypothetical protein